jgi:hypothetical protein
VFKPAILLNAAAIIAAHNLCGAPHNTIIRPEIPRRALRIGH